VDTTSYILNAIDGLGSDLDNDVGRRATNLTNGATDETA
jgi:hypothetical protein